MNCDFCGGPDAEVTRTVLLDADCVKFFGELTTLPPVAGTWNDWEGEYFTKEGVGVGPFAAAPAPKLCSHQLDIVSIPDTDKFLYLSGTMHRNKVLGPTHPYPEAAVYLDGGWISGVVLSNGVLPTASDIGTVKNPAVLYVEWPDFGVVNVDTLAFVVRWIVNMLDQGKRVEIGCSAGHGRTGTVAAAVLMNLGMDPAAAIAYLQSNYCTRIIELESQRKLVETYATYLATG